MVRTKNDKKRYWVIAPCWQNHPRAELNQHTHQKHTLSIGIWWTTSTKSTNMKGVFEWIYSKKRVVTTRRAMRACTYSISLDKKAKSIGGVSPTGYETVKEETSMITRAGNDQWVKLYYKMIDSNRYIYYQRNPSLELEIDLHFYPPKL